MTAEILSQVKRPPRIEGDCAYIPLTKGYEAIIDLADLTLVGRFNWSAMEDDGAVYAKRTQTINGSRAVVYLHRFIMGAGEGCQIDHRDGSGLNCRRKNMREATRQQNSFNQQPTRKNKHGYKGVSFDKRRGKWRASIIISGKPRHLGYFDSPDLAGMAYVRGSQELHGEFSRYCGRADVCLIAFNQLR